MVTKRTHLGKIQQYSMILSVWKNGLNIKDFILIMHTIIARKYDYLFWISSLILLFIISIYVYSKLCWFLYIKK